MRGVVGDGGVVLDDNTVPSLVALPLRSSSTTVATVVPTAPVLVARGVNWPVLFFVFYTVLFIATVSYLDLSRYVHPSVLQQYLNFDPPSSSSSPLPSPQLDNPETVTSSSSVTTPLPSPKLCPSAQETFRVKRLEQNNPIITETTKNMEGERGENINGPSLLYVPSWVKQPLGRYYLYFGHHVGRDIRVAYTNDLVKGPWRVLSEGCLTVENTPGPMGHIASPEVLVDESTKQIVLYFHGDRRNRESEIGGGRTWAQYPQITLIATSSDGLTFKVLKTAPLAPPYLRVFQWGGFFYGIVKDLENGGLLLRSSDGITPFEVGPSVISRMRHAAVLLCGDVLYIFFSRLWDSPERLLYSKLRLSTKESIHSNNATNIGGTEDGEEDGRSRTAEWRTWKEEEPIELLRPETTWEGADLPVEPGTPGGVFSEVNALRDPCVFFDPRSNQLYLLYTVKGEKGIAIAQLEIAPP